MGLTVDQKITYQCKKAPKGSTRQDGVALEELLDFLTTAQAHGVPKDACVRFEESYNRYLKMIVVEWKEER